MSLFTSDFRREARVLAVVVLALLFCEGGIRTARNRLSADVAHIESIPKIAAQIGRRSGRSVLFLGNSTTRLGVHPRIVEKSLLAQTGVVTNCYSAHPDASDIADWYYLFRRFFEGRSAPDYLILDFMDRRLSDDSVVDADRLGGYWGGWPIAREVLTHDLFSFGSRVEFALASSSVLFAERERVRTRVLAAVAPGYRSTGQRLNAVSAPPARSNGNYSRLDRLLALCSMRGTHAIIVAMPTSRGYFIDDSLREELKARHVALLDLRVVPGISETSFMDGYHLLPQGAEMFSNALARALAPQLQP